LLTALSLIQGPAQVKVDNETLRECPVVAKGDKYVIHAVPNLHDGSVSLIHTDLVTGKPRVFFSTSTYYQSMSKAISRAVS